VTADDLNEQTSFVDARLNELDDGSCFVARVNLFNDGRGYVCIIGVKGNIVALVERAGYEVTDVNGGGHNESWMVWFKWNTQGA
jgi:hypothetical protein